MSHDDVFSDDYVAQLLTKDAKESSIKYASYGLRAFLPKRPTTHAPRPNKRFLLNILRDTDNHNAALRAKEVAEARSRLRDIDREDTRKDRHKSRDEGRDSGERHDRKRRRIGLSRYDDDYERHTRHHKPRSHREDAEGIEGSRRHRRRHRGTYSDETAHENSDRPRHRHRRRRSKSRSTEPEQRPPKRKRSRHRPPSPSQPSRLKSGSESRLHRHSQRQRSRSLSTDRGDTASNRRAKNEHHKPRSSTARARSHTPASLRSSSPPSRLQSPAQASDSDSSDPLDTLIGPAPPSAPPIVAPRGRGAFTATFKAFNIDTHFAANYDPALDVLPNSDTEGDWDQALEALKDRQRWRQSGAERLRAAGFTEEEVKKWETGKQKGEEDVKWKRSGEGREWDRGKVVQADEDEGEGWGRLKGT
ncbi:MAG: hypothetical protein LQ342_001080 [Letrouitia transgressa]|nr:MAG: hypothetical protein LQ342_001080 [Letrouitia transgressa]